MGKIAFLFSGQGAQYPGMMKEFFEEIEESRDVFKTADRILGRKITDLCFNGTKEELDLTENTQPCVLTSDVAALRAVEKAGIRPDYVAGFSLGEYAAMVCAGVFSFEEAIRLIQIRASAMQAAVPVGEGGMIAVLGKTAEEVDLLCEEAGGFVRGANYNCPGQIVVSGETNALKRLQELGAERKVRMIPLSSSAPFHSVKMAPAAERLRSEFEKIIFQSPTVPVIMNIDGEMECRPKAMKEKLVGQTMSPVYWEKTLRTLSSAGVDTFIEIGPGKTLSGFVKKTCKEARALRVENRETLEQTQAEVLGGD